MNKFHLLWFGRTTIKCQNAPMIDISIVVSSCRSARMSWRDHSVGAVWIMSIVY
jgi:hypothetical protein